MESPIRANRSQTTKTVTSNAGYFSLNERSTSQPLFSVVVPCYNEQATLEDSVSRLVSVFAGESDIDLEVIIVDDCSTDNSLLIAESLVERHDNVRLERHEYNQGKGAALRTGFAHASGDFVGIHDADLEYDPWDLIKLLVPLREGTADVVYGSRFLTGSVHRVLYFWHSLGNKFLTLLSNMFTDLNLTDMETCYKVFRREVLQQIEIEETRFGFEPEITAKVAGLRVRVYEFGISYYGRTYNEGKKIKAKDGFRALYCVIKYNGSQAPVGLQLAVYTVIGGLAALFNLLAFAGMHSSGLSVEISVASAFVAAALLNYRLCIIILFRHKARWSTAGEMAAYWGMVAVLGFLDVTITKGFIGSGMSDLLAKATSSMVGLIFNFVGRRWLVFPEPRRGAWRDQGNIGNQGPVPAQPGGAELHSPVVSRQPVSATLED